MSEYKVQRVRFVEYEPKAVNCTAFEDSDRERLAVCRSDGSIEIWCTHANKYGWSVDFVVPSRVDRSIDSVTWCQSRLFTAGLEGELTEWDLESLTEKHIADANGGPVWCIAASNDKHFIAAGCEDGSVRIFDVQFGGLEPTKTLDKQEFRVLSLAWSKCDKMIVTGSTDSTIRVYNVNTRHVTARISTDKLRDKSTLIWSMHLTSNMTIISGDSLGQTQFWDAEMGTLIKSFKSHEADVLSVCMSKDEESVYSSGIDSRIAEFKFIKDKTAKEGEWRLTRKLRSVNHDIRTLSLTKGPDECLIAAGIDPRLSKFKVSETESSGKFLSILPDSPPCCFAKNKNILVFHESNKIHVWKLPFLSGLDEQNQIPSKLLELKSPREDYITCSDITANGDIVVFADINGICAYAVSYTEVESVKPGIQIAKIKLPKAALQGTQKIKLFPDGSRILFASSQGIGIVSMCNGDKNVLFFDNCKEIKGPWQLLEIDQEGNYAAVVNCENEICIFCLQKRRLVCKVPNLQCRKLAIKFQPKTNNIMFVCAEKEFHIYDFISNKLDHRCSKINGKKLNKMPTKDSKFINLVFDQEDNSVVFLQSEDGVAKVQIGDEMDDKVTSNKAGQKRKHPEGKASFINSTTKYSSLLYLDINKENSLIIVEHPLDNILNALPPALKVKRFGR